MKFIASRPRFKAFKLEMAYPLLPSIIYTRSLTESALAVGWLCFAVEVYCDLGLIRQLKITDFQEVDDSMTWQKISEYFDSLFQEKR